MRIIIDGDGSLVKEIAVNIAKKYKISVLIVTSIAHYTNREYPNHVQFIYVDKGTDAADFKIMSLLEANDILITQDYGLASLALPKATVLHHSGEKYTQQNIDVLLAQRHLNQKLRQAGKRVKGASRYTSEQERIFGDNLAKCLRTDF